jgi:SAM-dependent methyltransferase
MEKFHPLSVLDVGCGIGTWLAVFKENGVKEYFGIDGDYVDKKLLRSYLEEENFQAVNLEKSFDLERKFDLVISLEVAEHISMDSAKVFVDSLCRHSNNIVFSAAIPGQGGQNHLNEQWPQYWVDLFKANSFYCYDIFRKEIWDYTEVDWWYKQNIIVFTKGDIKDLQFTPVIQSLVHPSNFLQKLEYLSELRIKVNELSTIKERWECGKNGIKNHAFTFWKAVLNKFKNPL